MNYEKGITTNGVISTTVAAVLAQFIKQSDVQLYRFYY